MNGTAAKPMAVSDFGAEFGHFSAEFMSNDDKYYSFTISEQVESNFETFLPRFEMFQKRIESLVNERVEEYLGNVSKCMKGAPTDTSKEALERMKEPVLYREAHVAYLRKGLITLDKGYDVRKGHF